MGLHRSHAGDEDGARESDASANIDTRARALTRTQPPRPTSSLDDAVTHGSSARHPVTKLSAYKTTFIEVGGPCLSHAKPVAARSQSDIFGTFPSAAGL